MQEKRWLQRAPIFVTTAQASCQGVKNREAELTVESSAEAMAGQAKIRGLARSTQKAFTCVSLHDRRQSRGKGRRGSLLESSKLTGFSVCLSEASEESA